MQFADRISKGVPDRLFDSKASLCGEYLRSAETRRHAFRFLTTLCNSTPAASVILLLRMATWLHQLSTKAAIPRSRWVPTQPICSFASGVFNKSC